MMCREFERGDYEEVARWFAEHDLGIPSWDFLPTTGFIVPGVACGFLYVTDSAMGILDTYISNPESGPKERDLALDVITKHLIAAAKEMDCLTLKADTQYKSVRERAVKHGFQYIGEFSNFILEL